MEEYDEGFARNVQRLSGWGGIFEGMGDAPIESVTLSDDKTKVAFAFGEGRVIAFRVEGDCCSRSWIEHIDVPPAVIGQKIVDIIDARISQEGEGHGDGLLQVYNTKFITAQGTIVLEYRNSSNGYYGGYLVREGM